MKHFSLKSGLVLIAAVLMSFQSSAAAFVKYDGVDGESKDSKPSKSRIIDKSSTKTAGLLLPAVQKVRASAEKPSKKKVSRKKAKPRTAHQKNKGKVEASWKVEKGEK